tara:strand:+ start:925 stop:1806 length:882 start_codon:yes stop_codon:yes gene_type:complete
MSSAVLKLALGSANFGLNYGLTNDYSKISQVELIKILREAEVARIKIIDTAQAYGDSEVRVGAAINAKFHIVTKISVNCDKDYIENSVRRLVQNSCKRLRQSHLHAVLLHRPEVLLGEFGDRIIAELKCLKDDNIVSKIGISIYSPDILSEISQLISLDIVQAPFNIFDQRIQSSGWAERLKYNGTEIHTRSAFLQGLLLMRQSKLNPYFTKNWPKLFNAWHEFIKTSGSDPVSTALSFALNQPWIDNVVVGVDTVAQLKSLVNIEKSLCPMIFPNMKCDDERLLDPSKWMLV